MEVTEFDILKWKPIPIVKYPHPSLSTKTENVLEYNDELKALVNQMLVTMYNEPGCGLSANQVAINKRIFVTDTDYTTEEDPQGNKTLKNMKPRVFINPRFVKTEGTQLCEEGCLSFPGIGVEVTRFKNVVVEFEGTDGVTRTLEAEDFFADCLQHENDHLEGITFLDRVGPVKRQLLTKKYLKANSKKK